MLRRLALPLLVAVALLAASGTALGAPGFVADETLSSADSSAQDVAMAPNGWAIAGWVERTSGAPVVRVAVRPPGGPWSAPQSFAVGLDSADRVSVAISSSGAAAVTWEEVTSPSTFDVAVATRAAGAARFGDPEVLRDGSQSYSPSVGIAADGTVTLLYTVSPAAVVLRDFPAGGSALAATLQPLAASCVTSFGNGISVAPSGDAVAPLACSGASFALRSGGSWSVSPTVADDIHSCPSGSTYHTAVMATIDSVGHPVGVLETHVYQPDPSCTFTFDSHSYSEQLVLPLGGTMTPVPTPVASGSSFGFGPFPISAPQAAISPSGIVFAWATTDVAFRSQAHARFFALDGSGGTADQPVGTAPTGGTVFPRLALARDGRALLSWVQGSGADAQIVAAQRAPGVNAFGDPVPVSGRSDALGLPSLAMDDAGDGAAAWTQGSAPALVHVRGFDAVAPALSGVTIPAAATAGTPAAFAASASDVWGPVSLGWSFGDGSSGSGGAPTHAFASAGRFTVTVTATDAAGNASAASGTVTVAVASASATSDTVRITSASMTHRTFRVGRGSTPLTGVAAARRRARRIPVGTTFRFGLFVPRTLVAGPSAIVRIAIARATAGRLSGHRCVKPTRRLARHRRCTRFVAVGTLRRTAHDGANRVAFSGRIGRKALAPGSYRATLTPSWGAAKGAPRTLRFRVVR